MYAQTKSVITVYCVKVAYSYTPNQCIEKNEIMSLNLCVAFRTILPHFESSPFPLHSAGVHFAFLGRPLVGDLTYGRCSPNEVFNDHQRLTFEYWSKFESTMLWRNHETISFSGLLNSDCVFFAFIAMITCTLETIQLSPGESQSCAPLPARRNSSVVCPRLFLHCRRFSFPALPQKGGVSQNKTDRICGSIPAPTHHALCGHTFIPSNFIAWDQADMERLSLW